MKGFASCLVVSVGVLASCSAPSPAKDARVETVARNLEVPWALAFAPDGRLFVTERPGRLRVVKDGALQPKPLLTLEDVEASGESGLMSVALHPRFADNHWIYLAYAYSARGGDYVRVVRYRDSGESLADRKTIVEGIPAARLHAGTALGFGPDGKLYVTTGDAGKRDLAQKLDSLGGKTLRLEDDGAIPKDNPFVGREGVRVEIWSYGHRNAQGLDWQPGSGLQFQTEHGPSGFDGPGGGDEVNVVERGKNYGWPAVHHRESRSGMESPLLEYTPAVAPAGASFFRGSFFFACLRGERIIRVDLDGRRVVRQEALFQGEYGRIRAVQEGPDGALYFTTSNRDGRGRPAREDDRILRLVP